MKEEKLLRAIGSIAGDLILEAKEEPMHTKKSMSRPLRCCLIAALVAVILAATVSAAYVLKNWDTLFESRFQPTQEVKAQLDGNLDEPEASSTKDGATLSVRQTLCDGNVLYAIIDLQLPEDFDMSSLIVKSENDLQEETLKLFSSYDGETGHWYTGPATERAEWFQGTLPEEELDSLTEEKLEENLSYYMEEAGMDRSGTFLPKQVDVSTRTVSYLLITDYDKQRGGPVTVWFENLYVDETYTPVLSGPIYLSWTPQFVDTSVTYPLTVGENTVGSITLSPLTFQLEIPDVRDILEEPLTEQEYMGLVDQVLHTSTGLDDLFAAENLTFYLDSGETQTIGHWSCGGGYDAETDTISLIFDEIGWGENALMDVDAITKITIGTASADLGG
jgi:hypothetical protein